MRKPVLKLTRNQNLVYSVLSSSNEPMSAYAILDKLRDEGLKAPLQIYRALEKLIDQGMVHRLESLNAFMACAHDECHAQHATAFAICDNCNKVTEVTDTAITKQLQKLATGNDFAMRTSMVELHGQCVDCKLD